MKTRLCLWIPAAMLLTTACAQAQGTAFTYQGRLQAGTNHASGFYDLTFNVWTTPAGPAQVGGSVTNLATGVTNGLFAVALDFGSGVFDGSPRWLEIGVRTNGGGAFTTLSPRQTLAAAPYAIFAGGVSAAGISGTIPAASIGAGTITSNMLAPSAAAANLAATGAALLSTDPNATNLTAAGYTRLGGQLDLCWQQRSSDSAPAARHGHTAVWTGSEMLVWGADDLTYYSLPGTGGRYSPASNRWSSVTTSNAPSRRYGHTAVWTGSKMIIWGGVAVAGGPIAFLSNDGASYDSATDNWSSISNSNAPIGRTAHTAVWTGSEMIIWGGNGNGVSFGTGARYNPFTDAWSPMSTNGAPAPRTQHSAVWTGSEMIVWGGLTITGASFTYFTNGGRYDPTTDTWSPIATNGAPMGRNGQAVVWTGSEMIIWGGGNPTPLSSGGRYNPNTDGWSPLNAVSAPAPRSAHTAVWTGTEMLIWGGSIPYGFSNTGGRYNPIANSWSDISTTGAPIARDEHTAVWTGNEMIVFGGVSSNSVALVDTYSYTPSRVLYLYLRQ